MSDVTTPPASSATTGSTATSVPARTSPSSPMRSTTSGGMSTLKTESGTTTIADTVVTKIAALAAREVQGVAELGGSVAGAISGVLGRITPGGTSSAAPKTAGVSVEVGETQAAVDLTMKVDYPAVIHQVADAVRDNVRDRIESITGLQVVEVNINVVDLVFPGEREEAAAAASSRVE